MQTELKLSTGKLCPKCGRESLEECVPIGSEYTRSGIFCWDKHFHCVALCGLAFGLKRNKDGKINIGYDEENEEFLSSRFKFNRRKEWYADTTYRC